MKLLKSFLSLVCALLFVSTPVYSVDAELLQRLDRIERLLQSQGLLDMLQQIESLQTELSALQGDIELQNHSLEQIKKRQRDLYTDIDQRLQKIERGSVVNVENSDLTFIDNPDEPPLQTIEPIADQIAPTSVSQQAEDTLMVEVIENSDSQQPATDRQNELDAQLTPEAALQNPVGDQISGVAPVPAVVELDPVQIRAQYQQAFKLLKQSQYEQAIKAFREFLTLNPQSEYSDNAQYWLGEAYYVTREFETALAEYNNLLSNYPDSKKLTHSLLKIGFCYYEMGAIDEAKYRLENLRKQHPGTTAARLADERLKEIAQTAQSPATEMSN
ncbi:MAG: tol-pal system protein YbgF [Gammaproteobacteria bacterium]|nr:tol-pal system protein YbgF [Gammaproteobacteria bacterium]